MDDVEIVDTDEANHDALAAYYADGSNKDHDKKAVLDPYLGLAVEQLYGTRPPFFLGLCTRRLSTQHLTLRIV